MAGGRKHSQNEANVRANGRAKYEPSHGHRYSCTHAPYPHYLQNAIDKSVRIVTGAILYVLTIIEYITCKKEKRQFEIITKMVGPARLPIHKVFIIPYTFRQPQASNNYEWSCLYPEPKAHTWGNFHWPTGLSKNDFKTN